MALLGLGSVIVCGLVWYAHWRPIIQIDGAHLLYLPAVLACFWLGRRGLAIAALGGGCLVLLHFIGATPANPLEHDILRGFVIIVVGGAVAVLKERHAGARREAARLQRLLDKRLETSEAEYDILNSRLSARLHDLETMVETARAGDAEKEGILDCLVEHVVYQDKDRRILWANRAACESMGLARQAVVGRPCHELWAQADTPCPECPLTEAMETGQVCRCEKTTLDGRHWFLQAYPIADEQGELVGGVEVTLDITEQKLAQEELQRIFDLSPDMVCVADVNTATFIKVNPAWERTLGYTQEELLGRPYTEFVHPDDLDKTRDLTAEIAEHGVPVTCFRNRYRSKDGTYRWLSWTSETVPQRGLTYAVARDVTDMLEAEQALVHERNLLSTLINNLPDSIYVKDLDSRFLLCNNKVLQHTGVGSLEAILGKIDFDHYPRELAEEYYTDEQALMKTGRPMLNRERCSVDPTTGKQTWHSTTKLPLRNAEGEIVGLVGIGRDITDYKRSQEAYQTLVDHSVQGLVVLQDQGAVFANEAMASISGYSVAEILAASAEQLYEFVHPEDREWVWKRHKIRIEGQSAPRDYAFRILRKDGQVCWLEINATGIDYQGWPAIHASCMDITERVCAENALCQSETQNRALLAAIPDLMFRLDSNGIFLEYQAVEGQTLYAPPEEFLGKRATDILPEEVAVPLAQFIERVAQTGQPQVFEYQLTVDDSLCDQECRLVRFEEGQVLAIVRDVTERKRSERLTQIVYELAVKLSAIDKVDEGARLYLKAAIEVSEMDSGGIYLLNEATGAFELTVHAGLSADFIRSVSLMPHDSRSAQMAMKGSSFFGNHRRLGIPLSPAQRREGLEAMGMIPICHENRAIACLNIASHTLREVPEWSRTVLEAIVAQIGSTLVRLKAESAVLESEERFRMMFEGSPDGIFLADPQSGCIIDVNSAGTHLLGRSRQDIVGIHQSELHAPGFKELASEAFQAYRHTLPDGEAAGPLENAVLCSDGTEVPVEILARTVRIKGHTAILGTFRDITKRRETERALRESEERFRTIFENAVLGWYRTTPDGRILMTNPALVNMLGYSSFEELAKLNIEMDEIFVGCERSKFKEQIEARGRVMGIESTWQRRDGTVLFVRENAKVVRDGSGNVLYYEGTVEDITQRREAERALIASERNYREIFNATNDATFIHDATSGAILDANQTALDVMGYSREEILNLQVGVFGPGQSPYSEKDARRWLHRARQEGPQIFEWPSRRKNGECFWMEVRLKQVNIGGQTRLLSVSRDITERKEAEKAAQRHRAELTRAWHVNALGEMASGLAHELNQPLCAILNYANASLRLTRKDELPTVALKDAIEQIVGQAERAGAMIKRIRGLVGKREPCCTNLDVKALLNETMEMIEKEAAKHKVRVISDLDCHLPDIQADNVEIEQVALNLMRNAIEAMGDRKPGPRTLTVVTSRPTKDMIEVAVGDTGRGLSRQVREQVFDSFFTTKNQGLGIGLSLSRRIVEAHGGRLWAESDGKSGTTFRFTLPVVGVRNG